MVPRLTDHSAKIRAGSLADFLRAKRARLKPGDVGLPERRRRTPGLRREELAELAGVGVSWYTALEQGRDVHPSDQLLRNLAQAMRMTSAEARHLFFLAGRAVPLDLLQSSGTVSPSLQNLLKILDPRPALIANQQWDWLAWNQAADIFFDFDDDVLGSSRARNTLWQTFKGKRSMSDAEWEAQAQLLVGRLRAAPLSSSQPSWFEELVQLLIRESDDFRRIWNRYEVRDVGETVQAIYSNEFGLVNVDLVTLTMPTMPDAYLLVFLVNQDVEAELGKVIQSRAQGIHT